MCKIVVLYTSSKDVVHLWPFYLNRCLFYIIMFLGYIELVLQPWPLDFVRVSCQRLEFCIAKQNTERSHNFRSLLFKGMLLP